jgi:hypothetical protein
LHIEVSFQGPGLSAEVSQQAQLNVELSLPAGPLCLLNCKWLIVEQEMDEVLLGRPLLEDLGFDAPVHLSSVRDSFHNMDCSSFSSYKAGGNLTRLLLRETVETPEQRSSPNLSVLGVRALTAPPLPSSAGTKGLPSNEASIRTAPVGLDNAKDSVTYGEQDVDPIYIPQLLDMPKPSHGEYVSIMLEGMVSQAKINGLPSEIMPAMRELLKDFSDIWNISLTAGPPAKLPLLVINLKTDAIPVRVRLRRYSQEQREFLSRFVAQLEASSMVYRNPRPGALPRSWFLNWIRPSFALLWTFVQSTSRQCQSLGLFRMWIPSCRVCMAQTTF